MSVAGLLKAKHIGIKEIKNHLSALLKTRKPMVATDRGKPTYFFIPYNEMVEIVEILEELSDPETLQRVQEGRRAYKKGSWISVSAAWNKLGLAKQKQ